MIDISTSLADPRLTSEWFPLRPHPLQSKLWRTRARFVAVAAGRGSGKTELARRRVVRMLNVRKPWKDPIYFYALPTQAQARRVAWQKLKQLVPRHWLAGEPSESQMVISTKYGSKLYVVGMDKPQRIEGVQWDGGVIDESSDQKPTHFDISVRPALSHRDGWCWRIGVPKRMGPGVKSFKEAFDKWGSGSLGPNFESYSWPSKDVMTPEEIAEAMASMDVKDFDEQYNATWLSAAGVIFHAFDARYNVSESAMYIQERPIIVGCDFNVNPMAWVLMHYDNVESRFSVFDEVWMRNTHTQATLDALFARYGDHKNGWLFIGDATSRSRNTRATTSDYAQIANDRRFVSAVIKFPMHNPAVVDRFASTNALLCNAAGQRRLIISPKCRNLINDLMHRGYEEGTRSPDDSAPDSGHVTDALGYPLHYLCPVRHAEQGQTSVYVA